MTQKEKVQDLMQDYSISEIAFKISVKLGRAVPYVTVSKWSTGENVSKQGSDILVAFEQVYEELRYERD